MGREVLKLVNAFPTLSLAASIQPITRTVLKVSLTITPDFEWNDKLHGSTSDPWWIWVEDAENNIMHHSEFFLLQKKHVSKIIMYNFVVGSYTVEPPMTVILSIVERFIQNFRPE